MYEFSKRVHINTQNCFYCHLLHTCQYDQSYYDKIASLKHIAPAFYFSRFVVFSLVFLALSLVLLRETPVSRKYP